MMNARPYEILPPCRACYDNLMPSTQSGEPARGYLRNGFAARHLALVLAFTLRHALISSHGPASETRDGPASGSRVR